MSHNDCALFEQAIDDALDGRLAPADARALARHLADCSACRTLDEQLRWTRSSLRAAVTPVERDSVLEARLREALEGADAAHALLSRRKLFAGAAALAAGFAGILWFTRRQNDVLGIADVVDTLLGELREHERLTLPSDFTSADAPALEQRFTAARLGFPTRVIDLAAMNIRVLGGSTRSLAGRPATLVLYEFSGARILCRMVSDAAPSILPAHEPALRERGFEFVTETRERAAFVFWREGGVACVLVARLPLTDLLALAREKAMMPAAL